MCDCVSVRNTSVTQCETVLAIRNILKKHSRTSSFLSEETPKHLLVLLWRVETSKCQRIPDQQEQLESPHLSLRRSPSKNVRVKD